MCWPPGGAVGKVKLVCSAGRGHWEAGPQGPSPHTQASFSSAGAGSSTPCFPSKRSQGAPHLSSSCSQAGPHLVSHDSSSAVLPPSPAQVRLRATARPAGSILPPAPGILSPLCAVQIPLGRVSAPAGGGGCTGWEAGDRGVSEPKYERFCLRAFGSEGRSSGPGGSADCNQEEGGGKAVACEHGQAAYLLRVSLS